MFDFLLRVAATDNKTYGNKDQTYNVSNVNYKDKNNKTAVVNLIKDLNLDNEFTYDKYRFNMFIVVGSLVRNSSFFGLNHYPELTFAWVRSYDDNYSDAPSADSKTVNDLKVTATPSCPYNSSSDEYYGDCTLTLSSNYPGTTILYRLYTDEDNKGSYKLYKGSLDLPVGSRYYLDIKSIYLNDKYESDEELNVTYAPIYINDSTNNISEEVYGTNGNSIGYLYAYDDYNTYSSNNYRFIKWDKYTYTDSNNTEQSVDINSTSKSIVVDGTFNYARKYIAEYQPLITNVDVEFESGSATPTVKVKKYESDTETTLDTGDYNVSFRLDSKTDSEILVSIIVTLYENNDTNRDYYYSSTTSGVINNKNTKSYTGDTVSTYNADEGTLSLTRQYKYDSQSSDFYTVEVDYYDENDTSKTIDNVSGEKFVVNKVTEGTQSPITISAKEIDGEKFVAWYTSDGTKITSETEGYTLSGNKITFTPSDNVSLKAYYNPLITNVSGTIVSLIVDGTLPTSISDGKANTKSSSYEINGTISWEVYEDNTWKSITDLSTYKIKTDTGYRATITPSFKSSSIKYVISDNLTATINGNTLSSVDIDTTGTTPTIKYIMSTKEVVKEDKSLVEVYNPSSIKVSRSGDVLQTIKDTLKNTSKPITTKVLLADGTTSDEKVSFTEDELNKITYDSTNKNDQIISVTGNITYDNNPNNVSTKVTIRIVIPGLERMATPIASVDSGIYNNPIEVTLSTKTKSNETIYYSLDPEKPIGEWEVYDNKTFSFDYSSEVSENTGRLKPYTISAYVKSSDESTYRDSEIVTFTYTIVKKSESSSSDPYANVKWTEANTPCEVWNKSKNWTWSEKLGKCVYRVHNTKTK